MSGKDKARRARAELIFDGANTGSVPRRNLKSITFTDTEEDEPDDLEIQFNDREDIWLTGLIPEIKAAIEDPNRALRVKAVIIAENWKSNGRDKALPCGIFAVDDLRHKGPPSAITMKATALPFDSHIRQTENSRTWESARLSGIAGDIASANGMGVMFLGASDPPYDRVEQVRTPDIQFLSGLCHNAGLALKTTNNLLVLFDKAGFESKEPVFEFNRRGPSAHRYTKWDARSGEAGTKYASCRVSYTDPSGRLIEGVAFAEGADRNGPRHEVRARAANAAEARALAKHKLDLANRYQQTVVLNCPGDPDMAAGLTVWLNGWGIWTGKYIIYRAAHSVSGAGYTTQIHLRHVRG